MDLATDTEKPKCIKRYGLLASLMRGRALQLVKAVEGSNGFDAWRSLNKALKPTSNWHSWEQPLHGQHFQ